MVRGFENTFIRGRSPSYLYEITSENAISSTIGCEVGVHQMCSDNFVGQKFGSYDTQKLEQRYHKRNTFAFWVAVIFVIVLTVGNLILTLTIISVLRLGKGLQGMELIPEEDVIKFYGSSDFDRIYNKYDGHIGGFSDIPVTITGEDAGVFVKIHRNGQSHVRMILDKIGINFKNINTFEIKTPTKGDVVFTTNRPHFNMPSGANNFVSKAISASKISSPVGRQLTIQAERRIYVKGSEGINIDSLNTLLVAKHNIAINSTQGCTILQASEGILFEVDKIPIVNSELGIRSSTVQYKICMCMPNGSLYRIPMPRIYNGKKVSCAHFSSKNDPCFSN